MSGSVNSHERVAAVEMNDVKDTDEHLDRDVPLTREFVTNPALEKRLLRKIDMHMLPVIWLMYVLNYLDRNNIGNAKTAGMQRDLELSSTDFSTAISVFFAGYIALGVPSNMLLSRVRPRIYMAVLMVLWGSVSIGYLGVKNKGGLLGLRFVLGVTEAGFYPGSLMLMSSWYKKHELAKRYSIFYSASLISGAFGGLLAGAILEHLDGNGGIPAWKWLFLIEGVCTVGVAVLAWFILPDYPTNTRWLTSEEQQYAIGRMITDGMDDEDEDVTSNWQDFLLVIKDLRTWAVVPAAMCCYAAGTVTYFVPTLMLALGYSGVKAQFMTVPIYVVALVIVLGCCFHSDYRQERPYHIMAMAGLSVVSGIICATVQAPPGLKYAFLAFGASGAWACSPMMLTFTANTFGHPKAKRAVAIALVNSFANMASIYGSYIWPSYSAPKYVVGFVTCTMLQFGTLLFALTAKFIFPKYTPPAVKAATEVNV